jgi:hypothetical protein
MSSPFRSLLKSLEKPETGSTFVVQHHNFAVQNRPLEFQPLKLLRDSRIFRVKAEPVTRPEIYATGINRCDGSVAVPLNLENPFRIVERFR